MRYGVMFNHRQLGTDPAFLKDFAQAVEEARFDRFPAPEARTRWPPDRLRGERVHTYDAPY